MSYDEFVLGVVLVCFLLIALCIGGEDYDQAKKDHAEYCQNVRDGVWPDYQNNFKESCKNIVDTKTE